MNRTLPLVLALAMTAALAACKPQPAPQVDTSATPAPAPAEAPAPADATATADAMRSPMPFDAKAFAGTFKGTLPCADCPGIDTALTLNADASYTLDTVYQGKPGSFSGSGTWTTEANDQTVRLDPNSKSEDDRLFAIASNTELKALDREGKPIDTTQPLSLMREAAQP